MIILQQTIEGDSGIGAGHMFLITIIFFMVLILSGKINLGIYVPGLPVPLRRKRKAILKKYFPYYNRLSESEKRRFEQKVQYFIYIKDFIPRQIDEVTEEMKVLIAACAVQLTFGYPRVFLSHFKRILIYPTDYYSTINQRYHKGEVNPKLRAIVLAWDHFVKGYIDESDGYNLGLHEMAHALHLEDRIHNKEYQFLDKQALLRWENLALEEMKRIKSGQQSLLRNYAATNLSEFFSVAVENFFERPEKFKAELPVLYRELSIILRQDPMELYG